jgi:hypothetical protein
MVDNLKFFSTATKYARAPFYISSFSKELSGQLFFWKYQEFINSTSLTDNFVYMWKKRVDNLRHSDHFFFWRSSASFKTASIHARIYELCAKYACIGADGVF